MPLQYDLALGVPKAAQRKGHLALQVDTAEVVAIPPGARMFLVVPREGEKEDGSPKEDLVQPLLLVKVTRSALWFRCNCGKPKCTLVYHCPFKSTGHHPME